VDISGHGSIFAQMKSAFSLICIQLITHIRNTSNFHYEGNKYFQER